jgi:hypothetical protein
MPSMAHTCPRDLTLDKQFRDAKRVFLAYVIETRLEEKLLTDMVASKEGHAMKDNEDVKLVSAGYRVVENYKGDAAYTPRLMDVLGIGTGYVGLTPGLYFLVFLGDAQPHESAEMRFVDTCSVPLRHHRFAVPQFQLQLDQIRAWSKKKR